MILHCAAMRLMPACKKPQQTLAGVNRSEPESMETDYRPGSLQIAYATTPSAVGDHRITRVRVTNVIAARGDLHNLSIGDVAGEFAMPLHKHMLPVLVKDAVCRLYRCSQLDNARSLARGCYC